MLKDRRHTVRGSIVAPWLFLVSLIVICGCSQSAGPDPKYSDLSQEVHTVVQRTMGDPSKMTPEDRKVMADAKSYKILTPPGY